MDLFFLIVLCLAFLLDTVFEDILTGKKSWGLYIYNFIYSRENFFSSFSTGREHWQPFICLKPFLHFIFLMPFSPGDCPSFLTMCSAYIFSADTFLLFWVSYVELAQGLVSGSVFFLCLFPRCSMWSHVWKLYLHIGT